MKHFLTIILALCCSSLLFAQDFQVPSYKFEKAEDYDKYKNDILSCIDWLEKTPINQDVQKRKEASAFFIKRVEGSPTVSIELHEYVGDLMGENPDMFDAFMVG